MKQLLGLAAVLALTFAHPWTALPWDSTLPSAYEVLFAVLGGGSILLMVAVVASGEPTCPSLPPAFRRAQLTEAARCLVCNSPGRAGWVVCTRCETPHHADCARYAMRCAVYGCDKSVPLLAPVVGKTATRTVEPR